MLTTANIGNQLLYNQKVYLTNFAHYHMISVISVILEIIHMIAFNKKFDYILCIHEM